MGVRVNFESNNKKEEKCVYCKNFNNCYITKVYSKHQIETIKTNTKCNYVLDINKYLLK